MSESDEAALKCDAVYVLRAEGTCYQCRRYTPMFALMALPPFELIGDQDDALDDDGPMLREIENMPSTLDALLRERSAGTWRPDFSRTADASYWMNHCAHCDAKQGDFFVHGPDGPFWPYDEAGMERISAERIEGPHAFPFANTAYSGAMADWRDKRHGVIREIPKPRRRRSKA
jgi:hypothetical protein